MNYYINRAYQSGAAAYDNRASHQFNRQRGQVASFNTPLQSIAPLFEGPKVAMDMEFKHRGMMPVPPQGIERSGFMRKEDEGCLLPNEMRIGL